MKNLYLTTNSRSGMLVNSNNNDVKLINPLDNVIDYVYTVPEDCIITHVSTTTNKTITKKANKGDIIIKLYDRPEYSDRIIVTKNADFKNLFIEIEAFKNKKKAEEIAWAKKNQCENCCGNAGLCDSCC